jgi:UDP-N-acetylmuramoyl-L-alanine---L-glutamate ligase
MTSQPTSSPLRWPDLRRKKVGVWGVGTEGHATLAKLANMQLEPFAVVDDAPANAKVLPTANGGLDALRRCDIVIKSPGISRYSTDVRQLEEQGVAVVGGLGLWLETVGPDRVVGITGTKGKSTTTSVAGHLATSLGLRCFVGGNLGTVPWDPATPDGEDLWVIEISSYQATDMWSSPAVVGVTALHPDHLNWHGSVNRYYDDKLSLCGRKGAVITVANGTDERLRARASQLAPGPIWVEPPSEPPDWVKSLGLRGRHNTTNALIAARCLSEAGIPEASDPVTLLSAAAGYRPLPSRLETVATLNGVEYVDDSLSTNVLPTIAAAEVFAGQPLALIVGGYDRNIDYTPLAAFVAARPAPTLVLTVPQNGWRIASAVRDLGGTAESCGTIVEAVDSATRWTPPGGVVLLSPAAASYGIYRSYRERATAFRQAISGLYEFRAST